MESTSKLTPVSDRDTFYYRQRSKNRVFEELTAFFAEEAERRNITKRELAECLHRDPAQISRWLSAPSNFTIESISDFLLGLGAEMDYFIARFSDRPTANEMHPLIATILSRNPVVTYETKKAAGSHKKFQPIATPGTNTLDATITMN